MESKHRKLWENGVQGTHRPNSARKYTPKKCIQSCDQLEMSHSMT